MEKAFFISNRNESPLSALGSNTAGDGDTFLWSLVDLLTLLLIFFVFLYAQSPGRLFSPSTHSQPPNAGVTAQPIHLPASAQNSGGIEPVSIRPNIVSPPARTPIPHEAASPAPVLPDAAPPLSQHTLTEKAVAEAPMEELKQAALNAIHDAREQSCSVRWNQNRLVFVLGERFTFPVGQAELLHNFRPTLERIAHLIASKTDYRVMVSGHTDDTPIATPEFPSNWELSAARAITVAKSIIAAGVDPHRISVQGYGEYHPLHPNSSPENRQANRRVEIALFKQQATEETPEAL